jgi:hypothetical protein
LLKYFKDKKYYKINNKPVFYILHYWLYNYDILIELMNYFNRLAIRNGFSGIYYGFCLNYDSPKYQICDSYYINVPAWKSSKIFGSTNSNIENTNLIDYTKYLENFENIHIDNNIRKKDIVFNIFPNFNNYVRNYYKTTNISNYKCINANIENFKKYLQKIKLLSKNYTNSSKIFLVNAWNEWGENMVIEPSQQYGIEYLEILKEFIEKY